MATLVDAIGLVVARARKYGDRGLGEQNTKASMIEPILEALGWDIRDPDEVHREFRPTGRDSPVDYALKLMRKPRLFLEAKGLGETLADRRWIAQVLGYATVAGVEWCVLTDGDEFRFYNATAPIDAEEKMFCRVRLTEGDADAAARTLGLLSRSNLEQNLLDAMWMSHFVDRRVKTALREMLAVPTKTIVKLLRQQVPKLTPKQISDSIRRLDIRIESPAVTLPQPAAARSRGAKASKKQGPRVARRSDKAAPSVSLPELIQAGLLSPPVRLFCRYKGRDLEAKVLGDGQVEFNGEKYASCSTAAELARGTVTGRRMNTNGWVFWKLIGTSGKAVRLDSLRKQFQQHSVNADGREPPLRLARADRSASA